TLVGSVGRRTRTQGPKRVNGYRAKPVLEAAKRKVRNAGLVYAHSADGISVRPSV
ncbi:hypothetical protein LCGC14_1388030, partial [marine sediment metagenome]